MRDLDAPFNHLAPLPRTLWLPALVTSCGEFAQRLRRLVVSLASSRIVQRGTTASPALHVCDDRFCVHLGGRSVGGE